MCVNKDLDYHDTGRMHSQDFKNSSPVASLAKIFRQEKGRKYSPTIARLSGKPCPSARIPPTQSLLSMTSHYIQKPCSIVAYGNYSRRARRGPTEIEVNRVNAICPPPEGESDGEGGVAGVGVEAYSQGN